MSPRPFSSVLTVVVISIALGSSAALAQMPNRVGTLRVGYGNEIAHLDVDTAPGHERSWIAKWVKGGDLVMERFDKSFVPEPGGTNELARLKCWPDTNRPEVVVQAPFCVPGSRSLARRYRPRIRRRTPIGRKPTAGFDAKGFLTKADAVRSVSAYPKKGVVFTQGDPADAVFYLEKGQIKLTVVSERGKAAVVAMLGRGDFFGEGCLAGQPIRMATASAMTEASVVRVERRAMIGLLHERSMFSERFMAHLLARNVRFEEDLVDQLFNSSEKRLARVLLLLARFGKEGTTDPVIPKVSQEVLAEMVGTTRPRISGFMNKFRKLGFIEYNGGLHIHSSLLNVLLHA